MILACAIVSNLCPGEKEEMWVLLVAIAVLVFGAILLETIEKKRGPKQIKKAGRLIPRNEAEKASGFWFLANATVKKWISVAAEYCRVSIVEERGKEHSFAFLAEQNSFVFGIGLNEPEVKRRRAAEVSQRREILRYCFSDYGMPVLSVRESVDERAAFARWAAECARALLRKNGVLVEVEDLCRACGSNGAKADDAQSDAVCRIAYAPKGLW